MTDETGWEFETLKRVYANFGVNKNGGSTGIAWEIVRLSPDSTALRPEEVRQEKLAFAIDPREGKEFTIGASLRYRYAPPAPYVFEPESDASKMAEAKLMIAGKRPSSFRR